LYFDNSQGNSQNQLNDRLDAVELTIKLQVYNNLKF
jgi:hypothetical protein